MSPCRYIFGKCWLLAFLAVFLAGCIERVDPTYLGQQIANPVGNGIPKEFNPDSIKTFSGKVTALVKYPTDKQSTHFDKHIIVDVRGKEIQVILGPEEFFDDQTVPLRFGDKITLTGSAIYYPNTTYVLATEIKIAGRSLMVRDSKGMPAWGKNLAQAYR